MTPTNTTTRADVEKRRSEYLRRRDGFDAARATARQRLEDASQAWRGAVAEGQDPAPAIVSQRDAAQALEEADAATQHLDGLIASDDADLAAFQAFDDFERCLEVHAAALSARREVLGALPDDLTAAREAVAHAVSQAQRSTARALSAVTAEAAAASGVQHAAATAGQPWSGTGGLSADDILNALPDLETKRLLTAAQMPGPNGAATLAKELANQVSTGYLRDGLRR